MRKAILYFAIVLASACGGGGSPTGPNAPTGIPFLVAIAASGGGTFSATLNNQTYTVGPGFEVSLPTGTYEMNGTYTGGTLILGFATAGLTGGGVQSGSLQSLAGTVLFVQSCRAAYSEGGGPRSFRVRFTVGTDANNACR